MRRGPIQAASRLLASSNNPSRNADASGRTLGPAANPYTVNFRLHVHRPIHDRHDPGGGLPRNTCLLVPAAYLLGAVFGPLAATAFVEGENASAVAAVRNRDNRAQPRAVRSPDLRAAPRQRVKRQPLPVRDFRRSPSAARRMAPPMALAGLAGSCRQRLNFGVEQMGASDRRHRAALLVSRPNFAQRRGTGC